MISFCSKFLCLNNLSKKAICNKNYMRGTNKWSLFDLRNHQRSLRKKLLNHALINGYSDNWECSCMFIE